MCGIRTPGWRAMGRKTPFISSSQALTHRQWHGVFVVGFSFFFFFFAYRTFIQLCTNKLERLERTSDPNFYKSPVPQLLGAGWSTTSFIYPHYFKILLPGYLFIYLKIHNLQLSIWLLWAILLSYRDVIFDFNALQSIIVAVLAIIIDIIISL